MSHWDRIKLPSYGLSDGMVRRKSGTFKEEIVQEIIKEKPIETEWDWNKYDESIKERVKQLKSSQP